MKKTDKPSRVGIVGPCTSGKTTLIRNLKGSGSSIDLRHIAQEHSYVPHMWQVIAQPDLLVYLDVSFSESLRRKDLHWSESDYQEQIRRLAHARQHADFYLNTDGLTPEQVVQRVLEFLASLDLLPPNTHPQN